MRVSMLTCGTRGDTQPMTVLGAELRRRGHDVRIGASPNTLDQPRRCGFEVSPLGPDSQAVMESPEGRRWLASGNVRAFTRELTDISHATFPASVEEARETCAGADVLVAGILAEDLVDAFAEMHDVPMVTLHSVPLRSTSAYPHPMVTTRRLPGPLNALTGVLFDTVWWRGARPDIESTRAGLGLPPARTPLPRRRSAPDDVELQAYDALLVPGLEWGPQRPLVGFLTLDEELREALDETDLDPTLEDWLAAGDPPVFFGFGSMPIQDPPAIVRMISEVGRALGVRALVSAGWGRLAALEPDHPTVTVVGNLDHDAVLPRCVAAVHHGGAGTIAASLGAGIPTVVCSVFADQPFWGARVVDRGVGAHLRFKDLDRESLESGLRAALSPDVRARAADLGSRLRSNRGAAQRAADAVEGAVERHGRIG